MGGPGCVRPTAVGILVALLMNACAEERDFRYKDNAKQYVTPDNATRLERRLGTNLPALQLVSLHTSPDAEQLRVLCWVNTFNMTHDRARAIKSTWGRRCDKLLFMSNVEDPTIPTVRVVAPPTHEHLWQKHRYVVRVLAREFDPASYDWIFKCDDDSYVIMDNLKYFLARQDRDRPAIFGHRMTLQPWIMHEAFGDPTAMPRSYRFVRHLSRGLYYTPGGAGYAFNGAYLARLHDVLDDPFCIPHAVVPDDWAVSFCMLHEHVAPRDTRDRHGRERFHQYSPEQVYFWPDDPDDYDHTMFDSIWDAQNWYSDHVGIGWKNGTECCATDSIVFHYVDDMAAVDAFFYGGGGAMT
ncbi:hypothetical protein DYB32_002250 [Aphanomyces invadans]|uniref:N-acetylgalactosaminide beta-1,3-galactosyltransferase n=1 Tax=Aphanomyces invadans TaxID=157072 RepID=A0A418B3Z8_9STRA|nr:hypothetical protein DYB32_002250 [Aphanomyces invadans]